MRNSNSGLISTLISIRNPWRFSPGDTVYVRGWSQDYPVTIEAPAEFSEGLRRVTVPHYHCRDHLGGTWLLSQLHLSGSPISERKR
jgi:hypothetical protein